MTSDRPRSGEFPSSARLEMARLYAEVRHPEPVKTQPLARDEYSRRLAKQALRHACASLATSCENDDGQTAFARAADVDESMVRQWLEHAKRNVPLYLIVRPSEDVAISLLAPLLLTWSEQGLAKLQRFIERARGEKAQSRAGSSA